MNYEQVKKEINKYISKHSSKKNKYYLLKYHQYIKQEYRNKQMKLCSQYRRILARYPSKLIEYSQKLYLLIEQYRPVLLMIDKKIEINLIID